MAAQAHRRTDALKSRILAMTRKMPGEPSRPARVCRAMALMTSIRCGIASGKKHEYFLLTRQAGLPSPAFQTFRL